MKDIKTAPKDGTPILGYGPHFDLYGRAGVGFCEVYYDDEINCWCNITGANSKITAWAELPDTSDLKDLS